MRRGRGRGRNLTSSSSTSGSKKLECSRFYKKRAKEEHEHGLDIISNLPEDILHQIFSFIDMKQAIQTCILSRRWRYFWGSLPILKFNYNKANRITIRNEFKDFVDLVHFFRSKSSSIHEFTLVTNDNIDVTDRLNKWILTSVIGNVQQLTIATQFPKKFHFHRSLFTCKSLAKLVVRAIYKPVSFSLHDSITLPRLKTLSLDSVDLEEGSTNELLSGCPLLESLTITRCGFANTNVNISSPLLQHLILSNCRTTGNDDLGWDPVKTDFQLCAPNLISFYWSNRMSKHCAPKNLSSLVKAQISVYEEMMMSNKEKAMYALFMGNILRGLHNVEDLTLSTSVLQVVTGTPYLLNSQPTTFYNLRCLKLEGEWRSVDCIIAIAYFLKISPNIESLSFKVSCFSQIMNSYWNPDEVTSDSAKREDYWKTVLAVECWLNHPKCFELRDVTGLNNELEFLEFLLKNAMVLDKLIVVFKTTSFFTSGRQIKFSDKVLTFPRASPSAEILFKFSEKVV